MGDTDPSTLGAAGSAPGGRTGKSRVGFIPDIAAEGPGVVLAGTIADSPAAKAGFKAGDRILEFNHVTVEDLQDLIDAKAATRPGDRVHIVYRRGRTELETDLTVDSESLIPPVNLR